MDEHAVVPPLRAQGTFVYTEPFQVANVWSEKRLEDVNANAVKAVATMAAPPRISLLSFIKMVPFGAKRLKFNDKCCLLDLQVFGIP